MNNIFTHKEKHPASRFAGYCLITGLMLFIFSTNISAQNNIDSSNSSLQKDSSNSSLQKDFGMVSQFTGVYSSSYVQLGWSILKDASVDHFNVERSTDGINFRQIGKVSFDNEVQPGNYTFADILAEKGSNFYRLAIIDKDGNYAYSKIITIGIESKGISATVVYPNPFSKKVQVKISCENEEQVTIHFIDNSGNVVHTQLAQVQKGDNNILITNIDNLPPGIYYLEVIAKDRKMRTKLVKQQ